MGFWKVITGGLEREVKELKGAVAEIKQDQEDFRGLVRSKFDKLETDLRSEIKDLQGHFGRVDDQVEKQGNQIDDLKSSVGNIEKDLAALKAFVEGTDQKLGDFIGYVEKLESRVAILEGQI